MLVKCVPVGEGQIAQLVEQGIENPRVGGSIPSLATINAGVSPSGKAPVFGIGMRRFESCYPSHR